MLKVRQPHGPEMADLQILAILVQTVFPKNNEQIKELLHNLKTSEGKRVAQLIFVLTGRSKQKNKPRKSDLRYAQELLNWINSMDKRNRERIVTRHEEDTRSRIFGNRVF